MTLHFGNSALPRTTIRSNVLTAIGRLNTHARSSGGYPQRSAIYAYKTLAALMLAVDGGASLRLIKWTGKCNRCHDGRFSHWEWNDGYTVACRDCAGTGRRTLRFTETTLPDGQVWHHPWEGPTMPGRDIARAAVGLTLQDDGEYRTGDGAILVWEEPGAWHPLLPANPLSLGHLVDHLNEVEDWVEAQPDRPRGQEFWWKWEAAKRYLQQTAHPRVLGEPSHGYILELGRAPGGCFVCDDESDLDTICFGRMTPLLHWRLPVCKVHRNSPHPKDPPPAAMITPAIRRWLDRHERVVVTP